MSKKWFLLPPLLLLLAGCLAAAYAAKAPAGPSNDVVSLRRVAAEAAAHWEDPARADYGSFLYPFCVLSLDGTVLHRTGERAVTDVNRALASGYPVLDVEKEGRVVGRVIVTNDPDRLPARGRQTAAALLLVFSLPAAASCCLYYFYLDRRIARPFRELKRFASDVAAGKLDFPLNREKRNVFGEFTESFDMLREQLLLAKEREYQADRSRKELVASLSHDIKTPVTSIRLTSELLLELEQDERLRTKIKMIYEKTEQVEALVNNLFHNTLQEFDRLTVSPGAVYSSALEDLIRNADYGEKAHLSPIPDCMLYLDGLRFSQVLSNILSNSYKYADTEIRVECALLDAHLKMSVIDHGPGVLEDELPLLFNQFYRGSNASSQNGSGLGLFICKKIMEQMQGEIYCTCSQGNFTVTLLIRLA